MTKVRLIFLLVIAFLPLVSHQALGQVKGRCDMCHTMHNSQDSANMVYTGTADPTHWAGWNGSAVLAGGAAAADAQPSLLVSDCVGCHTSSTASTVVSVDGTRIPIVFNTTPPTNPLAGGNFYWVALAGGDGYGHNVRGISAKDVALSAGAPGTTGLCGGCHESLTYSDADSGGKNGCQGCHQSVKHHGPPPAVAGDPAGENEGYYRFLSAKPEHFGVGGAGVHGVEDPNWEQTPDLNNHNGYYGGTGNDDDAPQSMGKFCAGCHLNFHSPGFVTNFWAIDNGGGTDPWLRHPSDKVIPNSDEYINYTVYSPTVPVARPESTLTRFSTYVDEVRPGTDMVFCLSCHRAHGSPYPDMLRWDYDGMEPGTTGATAGSGCFKCHADKDDLI